MGQIVIRVNEMLKGRELREGRRIPLAEIAEATGISVETISELLRNRAGMISLPALATLCAYFSCKVGDLIHYDADPTTVDMDEIESRDIVARWESRYGADEHLPE
jgi:putative transcriptional regulator